MINKIKTNRVFVVVCSLLVFAMVVNVLRYGYMKQGFHMDELLTYGLSNSYFEPFPFQFGEWLPASYYNNYLTIGPTDAFSYDSVFYNQAADVHPPIYYIFFHTLSSLIHSNFTKWIGIIINITFYLLILIVLYCFSKSLLKDKWLSLMVTSFWGFSIGAISSVIYIRMYVLLTLWFIIFLFLCSKLMNQKIADSKIFIYIFLTAVGGVLTQYYFLIGAFFTSLLLCIILLITKRFKTLIQFVLTMLAALLSSYLIFPPLGRHLFETARGKEAIDNIVASKNYFFEYMSIVDRSLFARQGYYLFLFIILLLTGLLVYSLGKKSIQEFEIYNFITNAALIIFPAILYIAVIQKIAPYRTSRYIFSVFPMFVLGFFFLIIFLLNLICNNKKTIYLIVTAVIVTLTSYGYHVGQVEYLYPEYKDILNKVEDFSEYDALVIHDAKWKITGNVLELKELNEVLPLELKPNAVTLPTDDKIVNKDKIVVFINKVFNQNEVIGKIFEQYNFKKSELIYDHNATLVYFFE